jgi:hypothetical protein
MFGDTGVAGVAVRFEPNGEATGAELPNGFGVCLVSPTGALDWAAGVPKDDFPKAVLGPANAENPPPPKADVVACCEVGFAALEGDTAGAPKPDWPKAGVLFAKAPNPKVGPVVVCETPKPPNGLAAVNKSVACQKKI